MSDPNEILDQVDENGNVIGSATRGEFHSNPNLIHPVVHCWIFNPKGQILWQQRSLSKDNEPGSWDMSCGGHIASGETADLTLARQLNEELGVRSNNFVLIDKYLESYEKQSEFIYLYYLVLDKKINEFKYDIEEVNAVEWISPIEAQRLILTKQREGTHYVFDQVTKILLNLAKPILKVPS